MADSKIKLDVMEMVEQTVDAHINKVILESLEKEHGDESLELGIYKLLNEYGINGRKALEFIYKLNALYTMFNGPDEEEAESE